MKVVDAGTMRAIDAAASGALTDVALMRQAGGAIAELVRRIAPAGSRITGFAGPGNNGGDAFAACAELQATYSCVVYTANAHNPSAARDDAHRRAEAAGVRIEPLPATRESAEHALAQADVLLDGLFGVGARSDTRAYAYLLEAANDARVRKIALDLPTGVSADSGEIATPVALRADYTLMIGLPKYGAFLMPAREYTGEIWYAGIDIAPWDREFTTMPARFQLLTADEAQALLPKRPPASDKRKSGAPLLLAGSAQYPGAAVLCANGAARTGAGYVTVGVPAGTVPALHAHLVEQVVFGYDENDIAGSIENILRHARSCGALGIGPGMSMSDAAGEILRGVIAQTDLPFVLDATGLKHFHGKLKSLENKRCVLTPHASEFTRLLDSEPFADDERATRLRDFVDAYGITTLLKGNATLIADKTTMHLNPTGTSALATAGTGDVLTGIIATFLAQGLAPVDAARLGAYVHGLAGQAAAEVNPRAVMAGDLPDVLARVWRGLANETQGNPQPYRLQRLDNLANA